MGASGAEREGHLLKGLYLLVIRKGDSLSTGVPSDSSNLCFAIFKFYFEENFRWAEQ